MMVKRVTYFQSIVKTIQMNHGFDTAMVFYALISEASKRDCSVEFRECFGTRCENELSRIVKSFIETEQ